MLTILAHPHKPSPHTGPPSLSNWFLASSTPPLQSSPAHELPPMHSPQQRLRGPMNDVHKVVSDGAHCSAQALTLLVKRRSPWSRRPKKGKELHSSHVCRAQRPRIVRILLNKGSNNMFIASDDGCSAVLPSKDTSP